MTFIGRVCHALIRLQLDPTSVRAWPTLANGRGSAQSSPSALPTPCTRLKSGWGTMPKTIVAAPARTATNATSGWR